MTRENLIAIADRFIQWIQSDDLSPAALSACVAPEVVLHVPFPGLSPDFAGLLAHHGRVNTATKDMRCVVKTVAVDENASIVTQFWEAWGHQTGEWAGIPATGKPYKIFGFSMSKIDLQRGLITEYWDLIQDLSLLQQLGVIPMPGA